jgi:hypothetical protein
MNPGRERETETETREEIYHVPPLMRLRRHRRIIFQALERPISCRSTDAIGSRGEKVLGRAAVATSDSEPASYLPTANLTQLIAALAMLAERG